MQRYNKGRRGEYLVRDLMTAQGGVVCRSAGSHGKADLVAMWPHATYAVQVKCSKPSAKEVEEIRTISLQTDARWAIVWVNGTQIEVQCFRRGKPWMILPPGLCR